MVLTSSLFLPQWQGWWDWNIDCSPLFHAKCYLDWYRCMAELARYIVAIYGIWYFSPHRAHAHLYRSASVAVWLTTPTVTSQLASPSVSLASQPCPSLTLLASPSQTLAVVVIVLLVHGQVTIIFVVSVCLSVCLCRVFLIRLRSGLDQTRTHVTCPRLVVSPRI